MIDWQRQFPTFLRWGNLGRAALSDSRVGRSALDAWRGIERLVTIEVGRGVQRVSLWEIGIETQRLVAMRERLLVPPESVPENLAEDIEEAGAIGLPCELLLNPPLAVIKTFTITAQEAKDPARWIAAHREEVLPQAMTDDIQLTWDIIHGSTSSVLAVGLARRSASELIAAELLRAGCWLERVVVGPLDVLRKAAESGCTEPCWIVDRCSANSEGRWLRQGGDVLAFVEIRDSENQGLQESLEKRRISQRIQNLLSIDPESIPTWEALPHQPTQPAGRRSRWGTPSVAPGRKVAATVSDHASRLPIALERWAHWVFRWAALATIIVVLTGFAGYGLTNTIATLRGRSLEEVTTLDQQRARLLADHAKLAQRLREKPPGEAHQNPLMGRLWYDVGAAKPKSAWLRVVRLGDLDGLPGKVSGWYLEGLSLDRAAPQTYVTELVQHGRWQAQMTRLERVDRSKSRDIPEALRGDLFRFSVQITR